MTPLPVEPSAALDAARAALAAGDNALSVELLQSSIPRLQEAGAHDELARALCMMVSAQKRIGNAEQAIQAGQMALGYVLEASADRCELLCNLTLSYLDLGLNAEALRSASDALAVARVVGQQRWLSWANNRFALTCSHLGRYEEAERHLLEALAAASELEGDEETFSGLNNLGHVFLRQCDELRRHGDVKQAALAAERGRRYSEQALAVANGGKNTFRQVIAMANEARFRGLCADAAGATALLLDARAIAAREGHEQLMLLCDATRGELLVDQGQFHEALEPLQHTLSELQRRSDLGIEIDVLEQLTRALKGLGRWREALDHHELLHRLKLKQIEDRADVGSRVLLNRMELEAARHEADKARIDAERARVEAELQHRRAAELQETAAFLGRLAHEDPLTGLSNRRQVEQRLPDLFAAGGPVAVAVIDVDHFKRINDTLGHGAGDEVLRRLARLIKGCARQTDLVARIGGEEFLVVFQGLPVSTAMGVCDRLRGEVQSHDWSGVSAHCGVTVSVGLVGATAGTDPASALSLADKALYQAKASGRNRVVVGSSDSPPQG